MELAPSAVRMLSGPSVPETTLWNLSNWRLKLQPCSGSSWSVPKQQWERVFMSLSIQQVALQDSFLIKGSLQVEHQTGVSGVFFAEFREHRGSKREGKERGVYIGDKRLGASERGIMQSYSLWGMQVSQNYWLLIHLHNVSAHFICCDFGSQNDTVSSPEPHCTLMNQYNWAWRRWGHLPLWQFPGNRNQLGEHTVQIMGREGIGDQGGELPSRMAFKRNQRAGRLRGGQMQMSSSSWLLVLWNLSDSVHSLGVSPWNSCSLPGSSLCTSGIQQVPCALQGLCVCARSLQQSECHKVATFWFPIAYKNMHLLLSSVNCSRASSFFKKQIKGLLQTCMKHSTCANFQIAWLIAFFEQ